MSKDEFLSHLTDSGYDAFMSGSIPTVNANDMSIAGDITTLARKLDYHYSFAVKLKNEK